MMSEKSWDLSKQLIEYALKDKNMKDELKAFINNLNL